MASYLDWKRFNEELAFVPNLRAEEKKLYNTLKELNTGGWSLTSYGAVPQPIDERLTPKSMLPGLAETKVGSVSIASPGPVSSSAPVSSSSSSAPVSSSSSSAPVSSASPVSSPVSSPAPSTLSDLDEALAIINSSPPDLTVQMKTAAPDQVRDKAVMLLPEDLISKSASETTGSVSDKSGLMKYRKMPLKLVDSPTALNGVALQVFNEENKLKGTIEPITNGLMNLILLSNNISQAKYDTLWNKLWSKISDSDKINFMRLNYIASQSHGTFAAKSGAVLKKFYDSLDSSLKKYYATHKIAINNPDAGKGRGRGKGKQPAKLFKFADPNGDILNENDLEKLMNTIKTNNDGTIVGAGIKASKKGKKQMKRDKTDRLTLLLGSIAAGNNNKKQIEEALSLLTR